MKCKIQQRRPQTAIQFIEKQMVEFDFGLQHLVSSPPKYKARWCHTMVNMFLSQFSLLMLKFVSLNIKYLKCLFSLFSFILKGVCKSLTLLWLSFYVMPQLFRLLFCVLCLHMPFMCLHFFFFKFFKVNNLTFWFLLTLFHLDFEFCPL